MVSELFPFKYDSRSFSVLKNVFHEIIFFFHFFRARGAAAGLSAILDYTFTFISTKSYYNLETSLSMTGISMLNCIIATIGLILMYFILPETENRSLEDIELHFSDSSKTLCDRKIARTINLEQMDTANDENDCTLPKINKLNANERDWLEIKSKSGCYNRAFVNDV